MKVIALTSGTNNGKTNTLKLLYNLLLLDGFQQDSSNFWLVGPKLKLSYDIRTVLIWNGLKLGLMTRGDITRDLEGDLKHLESLDCQLVICASRKWKSWSVKEVFPNTSYVPKTKRTSPAAMYAANAIDAQQLKDLVKAELTRMILQ